VTERIVLYGCAPEPLIHYLKALGVLRIIAEQLDSTVRAAWHGDAFTIETLKTQNEVVRFFLEDYSPTPLIAPWNGSSGFYPKDNKHAITTLFKTDLQRLAEYRETIRIGKAVVGDRQEAPAKGEKMRMLQTCRNLFEDRAIAYLDSAFIIGTEKPEYSPLLGTGGNDGHFEFANNFMGHLLTVVPEIEGADFERSRKWIEHSLFAQGGVKLKGAAIGQFHPAGAGGANASEGASGGAFVNPWDYILCFEGMLVFAGAAVRRFGLAERSRLSFPFTVENSLVGYGTAARNEEVRAEMWLPLWSRSMSFPEVSHVFREGRARFGSGKEKFVKTGFDFARAIAELGVDRGIDEFQRFGFVRRYGKMYLAVSYGRFKVRERPRAALIHNFDRWLELMSGVVKAEKTPPRIARAQQRVDEEIFRLCESGSADHLREVLVALGATEAELAKAQKFRETKSFLFPLSGLRLKWANECDDGSHEFSIAAALSSICDREGADSIRENLEPVTTSAKGIDWKDNSVRSVWGAGNLEDNLTDVLVRRSIDARASGLSHPVLESIRFAPLKAINAFLSYETDDVRLEQLLRGLSLLNWSKAKQESEPISDHRNIPPTLPRAYALLKLLFLPQGRFKRNERSETLIVSHESSILPLLRARRTSDALRIAYQRLQATGLIPVSKEFHFDDTDSVRLASALLIPIDEASVRALGTVVLREKTDDQ